MTARVVVVVVMVQRYRLCNYGSSVGAGVCEQENVDSREGDIVGVSMLAWQW